MSTPSGRPLTVLLMRFWISYRRQDENSRLHDDRQTDRTVRRVMPTVVLRQDAEIKWHRDVFAANFKRGANLSRIYRWH